MVNSVTTPISPPKIGNTTKTSIFYLNDIHGQVAKMERIKSASDKFDSFETESKTDKLKFASGDIFLGEDLKLNQSAAKFLDSIKLNATAVGNHEFDLSPESLSEFTKSAKYKMLGLNTKIEPKNLLSKKIIKSYIEEKDGTKYGVIGLMPFDLFTRVKYRDRFDGFNIEKIDDAIKDLQAEVDKFKKEGVDKVIVLSHAGYTSDVKIAKEVEGLDVILGGHSHDLIEGINEGKNLFYSKKTGEPTIITQAGKDGSYFGILNLEFNDKGVITSAQNSINKTQVMAKCLPLKYIFDSILGKAEKVGVIASAEPTPIKSLIQENPHADFLADAMKNELKTDIAIVNSANLRGGFEVGPIDTRDISNLTPFKNKMTIIKITEKELVDALKLGASSITKPDNKPGILQVSGLKYTMNKSGEVLDFKFLGKDGNETPIDVKNPNTFKTYTVAVDDYYAIGKDGFSMLNKYDTAEAKFDFDKDKLAADYIKHLNKPVDIKADGRITVLD